MTSVPPADIEKRQVSLSLDETAIREFRKIWRDTSETTASEAESTASFNLNEGKANSQAIVPTYPPHERLKTPPGTPRWPGDISPSVAQARRRAPPRHSSLTSLRSIGSRRPQSSRRASAGDLRGNDPNDSSSRRFGRAVRDFFHDPSGETFLPVHANQRERTATVPRRVGRAYWQPPRSAHSTFRFDGSGHPFYSAPMAQPVVPKNERTGDVISETAVVNSGIRAEDARVLREMPSETTLPTTSDQYSFDSHLHLSSIYEAELRPDHGRTTLAPLSEHSEDTTPQLPDEIYVIRTSGEFDRLQIGSSASQAITVPLYQLTNLDENGRGVSSDRPLSPRDDPQSRYTADGMPVYRPNTANLYSVEIDDNGVATEPINVERHDSAVGGNTTISTKGSKIRMQREEDHIEQHRIRWVEDTVDSSSHAAPTIEEGRPYRRGRRDSDASTDYQKRPVTQPNSTAGPGTRTTRIVSAALPILLPIAAREGIIQPIRIEPQNGESRSAHRGSFRRNHSSYRAERESLDGAAEPTRPGSARGARRHKHLHRCPHVLPEARAQPGREVQFGRISIGVRQGDRCWQCKAERAARWMLESCFCQPNDGESETGSECEGVRVVQIGR